MWRGGFSEDATRASYEFISAVAENFRRDGTIREKYNAVTRSDETHVTAGYEANVIGFGWTNGVFLVLLHELPQEWVERLAKEQGQAAAYRFVLDRRLVSTEGYPFAANISRSWAAFGLGMPPIWLATQEPTRFAASFMAV